jgi:hypothetical protein
VSFAEVPLHPPFGVLTAALLTAGDPLGFPLGFPLRQSDNKLRRFPRFDDGLRFSRVQVPESEFDLLAHAVSFASSRSATGLRGFPFFPLARAAAVLASLVALPPCAPKANPPKPMRDLTGSLMVFNCRQW